jgi:hypothetical protein
MTTKTAGGKITGILALTFEAQEALEVGDPVSVTGDYEVSKCDATRPFIGIVSVANKGRAASGAYPVAEVPGQCTVEVPGFYVRTGTAGAAIPAGVDVGFDSAGDLVPMGSATAAGEANEVQTITEGGSGMTSFTIGFGPDTTGNLDDDITAADLQTALRALPSIGAGNVNVTGGPLGSGAFTVTFVNELAGRDLPLLVATPTGGTGTLTVAQGTAGATGIAIAKAGTSLMAAADGEPVDFLVR